MADKVLAVDLISGARQKRTSPKPSNDAMRELRKLVKYNSTVPSHQRISKPKALALLRSWGWQHGMTSFDRLVLEEFGSSWGRLKVSHG